MAAPLKVFVTTDGLTDYVVATSSRPKALQAWGAHQDLFKTGGAWPTDDPVLVKAARAQPGEVLRRPRDAKAAEFAVARKAMRPRPKAPPKAVLKKIAELEAALDGAQQAAIDEAAAFEAEIKVIEVRRAAAEIRRHAQVAKLQESLRAAKAKLP